MVSEKIFKDLLSSKARVKILKVLALNEEITISLLIKKTRLNDATVTNHLNYLKEVDLVQEKKFGRIKIYRLKKEDFEVKVALIFLKDIT